MNGLYLAAGEKLFNCVLWSPATRSLFTETLIFIERMHPAAAADLVELALVMGIALRL